MIHFIEIKRFFCIFIFAKIYWNSERQIKLCKIHKFTHTCPLLQLLSQFISPHTGRIYGRHITGEQLKLKMYYLLWISFAGCCFLPTKKSFFSRSLREKTKGSQQSHKESSRTGWVDFQLHSQQQLWQKQ